MTDIPIVQIILAALHDVARQHPIVDSVVAEIRKPDGHTIILDARADGRADVTYLDGCRRTLRVVRWNRDEYGTWVECPRIMSGLAYCRPENENGGGRDG